MPKKRKKTSTITAKKNKEPNYSSSPFSDLKSFKVAEETSASGPEPEAGSMQKSSFDEKTDAMEIEDDDLSLFLRAVDGIEKIEDRPNPPKKKVVPAPHEDEDIEAQLELYRLVHGEGHFDISATDEYVYGRVSGIDHRVMRKLRKGDFAIQSQLDLHGLTKTEAREKIIEHFTEAQKNGVRCVLVVHGRGLHSKDQIPVLKEAVSAWFQRGRGRLGRLVLAFATAKPVDGGLGAMYVLLRRPKTPSEVKIK